VKPVGEVGAGNGHPLVVRVVALVLGAVAAIQASLLVVAAIQAPLSVDGVQGVVVEMVR
jgi:hypothetical protein